MKLGEKGYTLVELLVVITIIAVASSAAAGGIFQIIRNTERNSNYMTAILQMQNAGNRISSDAQMAQGVTADNLMPPDFLLLSWIDVNTGDEYQVTHPRFGA